MVMIGQLNKFKKEENNLKKISWRGCCALMAFFTVSFAIAFLTLAIWHYYKKINVVDLASEIWNNDNIEIANRELIETKDDPFWGNPEAKIVIVEFSDFDCSFCWQMMPILRELNSEYPNQIKFIYRDFLKNTNSQKAAEAAQCANEQGQFLIYHDKLFLNQGNLDINNLKIYAREIGITNIDKFDNCLDTDQFELEVLQDCNEAEKLGVNGTPTFFVNGIKIEGARPKKFFEQIIEYFLNH
ncbi:MAG: thioredoxin domain-containing protein [bacterium]